MELFLQVSGASTKVWPKLGLQLDEIVNTSNPYTPFHPGQESHLNLLTLFSTTEPNFCTKVDLRLNSVITTQYRNIITGLHAAF